MTYLGRNKRLTFDVPTSLHTEIHASIPPGLFSRVSRILFQEYIKLVTKHGVSTVISGVLNDRIKLIYITEKPEIDRGPGDIQETS